MAQIAHPGAAPSGRSLATPHTLPKSVSEPQPPFSGLRLDALPTACLQKCVCSASQVQTQRRDKGLPVRGSSIFP